MNKEEMQIQVHLEIKDEEKEKGNFYELWNENSNINESEIIEGYDEILNFDQTLASNNH